MCRPSSPSQLLHPPAHQPHQGRENLENARSSAKQGKPGLLGASRRALIGAQTARTPPRACDRGCPWPGVVCRRWHRRAWFGSCLDNFKPKRSEHGGGGFKLEMTGFLAEGMGCLLLVGKGTGPTHASGIGPACRPLMDKTRTDGRRSPDGDRDRGGSNPRQARSISRQSSQEPPWPSLFPRLLPQREWVNTLTHSWATHS
jgi:hypothetical protein